MTAQPPTRETVTVTNPVLPGFHPDPSILRVGTDYYLATSTFQWYPGVAICHSRDLIHWRLAARPLDRLTQLDMRGNADSGGIWAPCLSHDGEQFHLIYTDVKSWGINEAFKDSHNYLTTAPGIDGPWSEPVYMNSSGFDPSLFHDDDGRKWFLNMVWDHRPGRNPFAGIVLQEYSPAEGRLVGPREIIFTGTDLKVTEGPHIYRRDGWYYLLTAEGGTSWEHAVTLARSRSLHGPYEVHPQNPLITAVDAPHLPIQKPGHASLTDTPDGQWIMAHLCGRPLTPRGECPLGRETALQVLSWPEGDWPTLAQGGHHPAEHSQLPALPAHPWPGVPARDDFSGPQLRAEWMTLRAPPEVLGVSLAEGGGLRLRGIPDEPPPRVPGRPPPAEPARPPAHQAGFRARGLPADGGPERLLRLPQLGVPARQPRRGGRTRPGRHELRERRVPRAPPAGRGHRRRRSRDTGSHVRRPHLPLRLQHGRRGVAPIGDPFSAGLLSDEHCGGLSFTGTFLALTCQDLSGRGQTATFHWAEYTERRPQDGPASGQTTLP